jgi:hypothetical protein
VGAFGSFSLGKPCGMPFYGLGFAGIPQGQTKKMNKYNLLKISPLKSIDPHRIS